MKLENLEVGMKIKNYKKLCELMEEPEKSGASKRAQVSEWERYVSFERQGNAFIVKEIRDVPLVSWSSSCKIKQVVALTTFLGLKAIVIMWIFEPRTA